MPISSHIKHNFGAIRSNTVEVWNPTFGILTYRPIHRRLFNGKRRPSPPTFFKANLGVRLFHHERRVFLSWWKGCTLTSVRLFHHGENSGNWERSFCRSVFVVWKWDIRSEKLGTSFSATDANSWKWEMGSTTIQLYGLRCRLFAIKWAVFTYFHELLFIVHS